MLPWQPWLTNPQKTYISISTEEYFVQNRFRLFFKERSMLKSMSRETFLYSVKWWSVPKMSTTGQYFWWNPSSKMSVKGASFAFFFFFTLSETISCLKLLLNSVDSELYPAIVMTSPALRNNTANSKTLFLWATSETSPMYFRLFLSLA